MEGPSSTGLDKAAMCVNLDPDEPRTSVGLAYKGQNKGWRVVAPSRP